MRYRWIPVNPNMLILSELWNMCSYLSCVKPDPWFDFHQIQRIFTGYYFFELSGRHLCQGVLCGRHQFLLVFSLRTGVRPNSHRTRDATRHPCNLERFSFDVACQQCEHSHWQQPVPFAGVTRAHPVWIRPNANLDCKQQAERVVLRVQSAQQEVADQYQSAWVMNPNCPWLSHLMESGCVSFRRKHHSSPKGKFLIFWVFWEDAMTSGVWCWEQLQVGPG